MARSALAANGCGQWHNFEGIGRELVCVRFTPSSRATVGLSRRPSPRGKKERHGGRGAATTIIWERTVGREGVFVEWTSIDFSRGVVAVYEWERAERVRAAAVLAEVDRLSNLKHPERPPYTELARMAEGARVGPPLWYRIVGFNPWTDRDVGPEERRAGMARLLAVVRELFLAEWNGLDGGRLKAEGGFDDAGDSRHRAVTPSPRAAEQLAASALSPLGEGLDAGGFHTSATRLDRRRRFPDGAAGMEGAGAARLIPGDGTACRLGLLPGGAKGFGGGAPNESGGASRIFLGRQDAGGPAEAGGAARAFMTGRDAGAPVEMRDPLVEICHYLGIAKVRLSALCLERTGLSIHEFLDVARVAGIRARLEEVVLSELSAWRKYLAASDGDEVVEDSRARALRFLKWMRVNARGVARQRLAWERGMPTKARLTKAVFLAEGVTLEELELEVATDVLMREEAAAFEAPTVETSVMMEILNARSAEKSELCSGTDMEPQRHGDTEGKEGAGEVDSGLEGLGAGEVA